MLYFCRYLIETIYTRPSTDGYCSVDNAGTRHQSCRCTLEGNKEFFCKVKCDIDTKCRGYSYYSSKDEKCDIYTTGSCPHNCVVKHSGNIGEIRQKNNNDARGCFIKKETGRSKNDVQELMSY